MSSYPRPKYEQPVDFIKLDHKELVMQLRRTGMKDIMIPSGKRTQQDQKKQK